MILSSFSSVVITGFSGSYFPVSRYARAAAGHNEELTPEERRPAAAFLGVRPMGCSPVQQTIRRPINGRISSFRKNVLKADEREAAAWGGGYWMLWARLKSHRRCQKWLQFGHREFTEICGFIL